MRSVTLTLSEDDLYRLYMAMHCKLSECDRLAETAPSMADRIRSKYTPVLDRVQAAYQKCLTEENHVGSANVEADSRGL